ncbi:LysR family transcriptional regulator [Actinocorallia sp. B10E7]|uniref:LysR family transcriptional regulator n=1 Tax=Actinocorallia sp. B10E7 TaxID=3153558 RepID=UPI00325D5DA7
MAEFTLLGLRVVREAARCGSFSMAAERLGYTQSAVSRQIALMEQAAGRPLFERQARGVRMTAAGRIVVRHAEAVLGELAATREDLRDLGARSPGRLQVGAFSTAMADLVPRAIAGFVRTHPHTRVPLREGISRSLLTSLSKGRLDLAVVTPPDRLPVGVETTPLLDDPLLVATPREHPFVGLASVTTSMLRGERWIVGSTEPDSTLLGAWMDAEHKPDVAFVARDWVAKLGLVSAGLGVTVVPGLAVPALPASIEVVRIDHPAAIRTTAVAYRRDMADDHDRRAFTDTLLDAAAETSASVRFRLRHGGTAGRSHG